MQTEEQMPGENTSMQLHNQHTNNNTILEKHTFPGQTMRVRYTKLYSRKPHSRRKQITVVF